MNIEDLLLEDYKLKVQYLTAHFSRMWTRFNFFLTINSALFAFSVQKDTAPFVPLFVVAGILLSILWYGFGATDNYLVEVYRKQVGYSHKLLVSRILPQSQSFEEGLRTSSHVLEIGEDGQPQSIEDIEEALRHYSHAGEIREGLPIKGNALQWRLTHWSVPLPLIRKRWEFRQTISATELAVLLPIVFFLLWVGRLMIFLIGWPQAANMALT
jgi:hypothetical protein